MIDLSKIRLGRNPKKHDRRNLMLARYLSAKPVLPAAIDWTPAVKTGLFDSGWPMFKNDAVGCCAEAAPGHMIECWTANAGIEQLVTDDAIIAAYSAITGYNPGDPSTDNGSAELDVLNYWRQTGIGGHRITAFVEISPASLTELRAAVAWFGGVYIGLDLPMSAQAQTGFVWDTVANDGGEWGDHAVNIVAFDQDGFICITWGQKQRISNRFISSYCAEAYAIISPDWLNSAGISPSGFDLSALNADLAQIGSI